MFDSNQTKEGYKVIVGSGDVIDGWNEALVRMRKGMKARVTIPPELAYGKEGYDKIPPDATIVFDMEVVSVTPS